MHRLPLILGLGSLIAVSGAAATATSQSPACPRGALALAPNSIAPASRAAFGRESRRERPQVTGASFARTDPTRGATVKSQCGKQAWQRTVVVYIDLRAFHPSQSLSQRVSFVSRFPGGYRVWEIAH
jgi:hypothetical protein